MGSKGYGLVRHEPGKRLVVFRSEDGTLLDTGIAETGLERTVNGGAPTQYLLAPKAEASRIIDLMAASYRGGGNPSPSGRLSSSDARFWIVTAVFVYIPLVIGLWVGNQFMAGSHPVKLFPF